MNEAAFIRRRRADWTRLEAFAARLESRTSALTPGELFGFVSLYRKVTGDLARARTMKLSPKLLEYLNTLVGKVHFLVYTGRSYPVHKLADFFRAGFPRTVRRLWKHLAAAILLLLAPALAAYVAVDTNPHLGTAFAPPGYVDKIDEMFGDDFGEGRSGGMGALATSFYIVNNIQVSFLAFALGVFLGLGTAFILVYNGMILGGVTAIIGQHGLSYNFWSFVSSHGAVELGAIVIAGAAGLRIGLSLLNPGMLRRKDAIAAAARDAGLLMGGVVTLLAIAAFIEGFISPSTLPNPVKLVFGILNLLALVCYLVLAGRGTYAPGPNASR